MRTRSFASLRMTLGTLCVFERKGMVADEILRFAQDDTGRKLRLMPSGQPQGASLP